METVKYKLSLTVLKHYLEATWKPRRENNIEKEQDVKI
jgi:hypothetical protein